MADISIIVPIYNGEKTIARCLESIINQTTQNLEIICVNDGSTDNTYRVLEEYAMRDSRVIIINKENEGLVAARKSGVLEATSKYIGFVDCDDWIESSMYERLCSIAKLYDVDMVCSGYILEGSYISKHFDNVDAGLYLEASMRTIRENIIYNVAKRDVGIRATICSKLFLRSIFLDVMDTVSDELTISEDKVFGTTYLMNCHSVYILHEAFYHYVLNTNSMSQSYMKDYLLKVSEVYNHFQKLYSHPDFSESMRLQAELYITELLYKGINQKMGFNNTNLLWIDPYYIKQIPTNAKLVLYGGGSLGKTYHTQLRQRKDINILGCISLSNSGIPGVNDIHIENINDVIYDYILITIKNSKKAEESKKELTDLGIPEEKIIWFDQTEIFWKFALAMGYLE